MPGLSPNRIKGFSAYQSARSTSTPHRFRLDKTRPKSHTLVLQGQVSVEPVKLASLWSQRARLSGAQLEYTQIHDMRSRHTAVFFPCAEENGGGGREKYRIAGIFRGVKFS